MEQPIIMEQPGILRPGSLREHRTLIVFGLASAVVSLAACAPQSTQFENSSEHITASAGPTVTSGTIRPDQQPATTIQPDQQPATTIQPDQQPATTIQPDQQPGKKTHRRIYVIPDGVTDGPPNSIVAKRCKPGFRPHVLGPVTGSRGDAINPPTSKNVDPGMATDPTALPRDRSFETTQKQQVTVCVPEQ